MTIRIEVGDRFPDLELPDHERKLTRLSMLTTPSLLDETLGFEDGYPLVLVFYRGYFCPRDERQMRQLVEFQQELEVNYCKLAAVGVDPPPVQAAFRAGLGARWPFLADENRDAVRRLGILDATEGEYALPARPFAFVLRPDLTIHKIYDGWFYVGRPTLEELRHDLREIMKARADYPYEAYDTPKVRAVRIPQQEWASGAPRLGESGLPVADGEVRWFDPQMGGGGIVRDGAEGEVFFHFTAIPGEGARSLPVGTRVRFELVEGERGATARNVQRAEA